MVRVSWRQDAEVRTSCRLRALGPYWSLVEQPKPRCKRSAAMVERRTWVNIAVHPCLLSFLMHNKHPLFENKVWEIRIFIKKCISSLLKSSLPVDCFHIYLIMYTCSFMWLYNILKFGAVTKIWDQIIVLLWFWDSSRNCRVPYCVWEDERCICIVLWCLHVRIANHAKNSMK